MIAARKSMHLAVGVCGVMLLATPALAGIGAGNWEAGFSLGATEFDSDVSDKTGIYIDLRGGYFLGDTFQLEGQFSGAEAETAGLTTTLSSLFGNGVFNFHAGPRTVPYVLVGIGSTNLEFDAGGFSVDDDATSFQGAIGSRFFVGRFSRMAVRVELSAISEDTFDERSTHYNLAAGLTWRIGKAP